MKKTVSQVISILLVLAFVTEYTTSMLPPAEAVEAVETFSVVTEGENSSLGLQSGVEDIQPNLSTSRSREKLLAIDGIAHSDTGEVTAIKTSLLEDLTAEDVSDLLFDAPLAVRTVRDADASGELQEQFHLTEEQIAQGSHLHGSMLAFTSELADLAANERHGFTDDSQVKVLAELIASGYTCSQALNALVAADTLELTIDEVKNARIAEIEQSIAEPEQEDAASFPAWARSLAGKLGLPIDLVVQTVASPTRAEEIGATMRQARAEVYSVSSAAILAATPTSDRISYSPQEVLGQPYSYDQQGNFSVNLNTGAYSYTETDLNLPGKNGLDLNLTRQYHSEQARATYALAGIDPSAKDLLAFEVFYRWYIIEAETFQYTGKRKWVLKQEITNREQYTILDSVGSSIANADTYYTLNELSLAVAQKNAMAEAADSIYVAKGPDGARVDIALVPTIIEYGNTCVENVDICAMEDNYLVDEFGLGHGWMLGLSHFRRVYDGYGDINTGSLKMQLTTSDGTRYYIQDGVGTSGNAIENYDLNDIAFRRCVTNEYPGAVYGLYHKDGKKEYFDSNGRNIAIQDRFGNTIKIAYTFADTKSKVISQIKITDTLNNDIRYECEPLETEGTIRGVKYNGLWKLSLNGAVIRQYYTYTQQGEDPDARATQLQCVKNETGEYTLYSSSMTYSWFNCMLQPNTRPVLTSIRTPRFANDAYELCVPMTKVTYPNGGKVSLSLGGELTSKYVETLGDNGYHLALRCYKISTLDSSNVKSNITRKYCIGDYDGLEGTKCLLGEYDTDLIYSQTYPIMNDYASSAPSGVIRTRSVVTYHFNESDQMTQEVKTSYAPSPLYQDTLLYSQMDTFESNCNTKWTAQTTDYTYSSSYRQLPTRITHTYSDAVSNQSMKQDESYSYDSYGNILSYTKPNGQRETYTYDKRYNLPLTTTYQQNASTKITLTNTLTTDGKSIASTGVKSNNTTVQKTVYRYDEAGRRTEQDDYLSANSYVTTSYTYNGAPQPTQITVSGVTTASGNAAMGSPGFAAGTIAKKLTYNSRGQVTSETDANGNTTNYAYDAAGRLVCATLSDGTTYSYAYDVVNNEVTYTDPAGSQWLCVYGNSGKLQTVTDLQTSQVLQENIYDQYDNLVKQTVFGNSSPDQITYYRYDTDGRLIEKACVSEFGNPIYQELYEYQDGAGKIIKTVVGDSAAPSVVTTSYLDNMGNTVKTGRFYGGTEYFDTYTYDYVGNLVQSKSAYTASLGGAYTTKNTYDYAGRLLSSANALGQTTSKTYDWQGNQLTDTNPSGKSATYTYDILGRLLQAKTPLDSSRKTRTDYTYDPNGNLTSEAVFATASTSRTTHYEYDAQNRLILTRGNGKLDGESGSDQYQYTQYTYDELGNVTNMYTGLHAPLTISAGGAVSANGDADYSVTSYAYDRYSRILFQTDPLGAVTSYTYDLNGTLSSSTNRRGVTTYNMYDEMGRLVESEAGGDALSFTYTATGQRYTASSNGEITTYAYDDLGRLTSENLSYVKKEYSYNIGDLRTRFTVTASAKTYLDNAYTYDALGRLTSVNGSSVKATYSYNKNGNLASTSYNNNTSTAYTYNEGNLPTVVQNKKGSTTLSRYAYTYALDRNQLTKTDHKSRKTTYTYDGLNRLTNETQTGYNSFSYTYTYDDYGNRATMEDTDQTIQYAYDLANHLSAATTYEATSSLGSGATATSIANSQTKYQYDAQGNMTERAQQTHVSASSGSDNAIMSADGTFAMIQDPWETDFAVDFTYDGFSRLASVCEENSETVYTYDADGHRTSKTAEGATCRYVWDGDQLVVSLGGVLLSSFTVPAEGSKTVMMKEFSVGKKYYVLVDGTRYSATAKFVRGEAMQSAVLRARRDDERPELPPVVEHDRILLDFGPVSFAINDPYSPSIDIDGLKEVRVIGPANANVELYDEDPSVVTEIYIRGLSLVAAVKNGQATYYHYNAHGDVVQLTNSSGSVTKDYTYDAFGVENAFSFTDENLFRYCGEQYDPETGNYYLRARYYDPTVGRFTQEDTVPYVSTEYPNGQSIIDPLSLNLYTYCYNNPLRYRDPSGNVAVIDDIVIIFSAAGTITIMYSAWLDWVNSPSGQQMVSDIQAVIVDGISLIFTNSYDIDISTSKTKSQISTSWFNSAFESLVGEIVNQANIRMEQEHTKGARKSTENKHQKGRRRNQMDKGGEKGDARRKPNPNKRRY